MLKFVIITLGAIIITKPVNTTKGAISITKELVYQFSIVLQTYIFVIRMCIRGRPELSTFKLTNKTVVTF